MSDPFVSIIMRSGNKARVLPDTPPARDLRKGGDEGHGGHGE